MGTPSRSPEKESAGPDALAPQRGRAVRSFLLDHHTTLPALASRLGGRDAVFESAIRGNSMAPAIPGGARIRVRLLADQPCRPGDIVFFLSDGGFMVHRIVYQARTRSAAGYLLTLGDNCLVPDPPVRIERILGTVTAVQTAGGWSPPGLLVHHSVCHRLSRAAATGAAIAALWCSASVARRLAVTLRRLESIVRAPIGRLLRRLRLTPPLR